MGGTAERPAALTIAVVAFVLVVGLSLVSLKTETMVVRATSLTRFKPGDKALHDLAGNTFQGGQAPDAYTVAARRNLSDFQHRLLSISVPFFGVSRASGGRHNAANLWKLLDPIITCPPDQPLVRYGPGGDGSKLLCKLPTFEDGACVIYSLGSNGKPLG